MGSSRRSISAGCSPRAKPSPARSWWLPPSSPPAVLRPRSAASGPQRGRPPPTRTHVGSPRCTAKPTNRQRRDAAPAMPTLHDVPASPVPASPQAWARASVTSACRGRILGGDKGWVTCRTGAGAWDSRTSRFRQQRGERRKMPQTRLERWSGTGRQSWQPQEGSVAPTRIADTGTLPKSTHSSQNRHQHQKTLLLPPRFLQSWKFLHKACQGGFGRP